jgi:hypothetical protein
MKPERHDCVRDIAADLVDHDAVHGADLVVVGSIDGGAVHLVATDQRDGFPSIINHGCHVGPP